MGNTFWLQRERLKLNINTFRVSNGVISRFFHVYLTLISKSFRNDYFIVTCSSED